MICERNKERQGPTVWFFDYSMGLSDLVQHLYMKRAGVEDWTQHTVILPTDLWWTEVIFFFFSFLVRVIDGRSRAFAVLWLDHVARTHKPRSDRMRLGCICGQRIRVHGVDVGCWVLGSETITRLNNDLSVCVCARATRMISRCHVMSSISVSSKSQKNITLRSLSMPHFFACESMLTFLLCIPTIYDNHRPW